MSRGMVALTGLLGRIGSQVAAESLGIVPHTPTDGSVADSLLNDWAQTYQPSLTEAQAMADRITAALAANKVVTFNTPGTFYIGKAITLTSSYRKLVATVPGVVFKMHTSMLDYMLLLGTQDLSTSAKRKLDNPTFDANTVVGFIVDGIEFQRSAQGGNGGPGPGSNGLWAGHSLWFQNFWNCRIDRCTFTTYDSSGRLIGGKYSVLANNFVGLRGVDNRFNCISDGIHLQGPCSDADFDGLTGFTGDNMTAIVPGDTPAIETTFGHARRIRFANYRVDVPRKPDGTPTTIWNGSSFVTPVGSVQPFRIDGHDSYWASGTTYTPASYEVSDVIVENMSGPMAAGNTSTSLLDGVHGDGSHTGASGIAMRRIRFRNINTINGNSTARVSVSTPKAYEVDVDGIDVVTDGFAIWVTSTVTGSNTRLSCRNIRSINAPASANLIVLDGYVGLLTTNDCELTAASSAGMAFLRITGSGGVDRWVGNNIKADFTGGGTCRFVWCDNGTQILNSSVSNVRTVNCSNTFNFGTSAATNRSKIQVTNWDNISPASTCILGRVDVQVDGVYNQKGTGALVDNTGTGRPSLYVHDQWSELVLLGAGTPAEGGASGVTDFGNAASANSGNIQLNSITRFAGLAPANLPRGAYVSEIVIRALTSSAFSAGGTSTLLKMNCGTSLSSTRFGTGTVDLHTAGTNIHEHFIVTAANQEEDENADRTLAVTAINTGTGTWANCTAFSVSLRVRWGIRATGT